MLLEDPVIKQYARSLTVTQYHALVDRGLMTERVELLEGAIVEKMPQSPLHAFLVIVLAQWLQKAISGNRHLRTEKPITCLYSVPEPDLAIVRGQAQDYLLTHPDTAELVVEIAVSSVVIDRRKAAIYAAAGVGEYWIMLPETRQVEVHSGLANAQYTLRRLFSEGQAVRSEMLPAFEVRLEEIFPR